MLENDLRGTAGLLEVPGGFPARHVLKQHQRQQLQRRLLLEQLQQQLLLLLLLRVGAQTKTSRLRLKALIRVKLITITVFAIVSFAFISTGCFPDMGLGSTFGMDGMQRTSYVVLTLLAAWFLSLPLQRQAPNITFVLLAGSTPDNPHAQAVCSFVQKTLELRSYTSHWPQWVRLAADHGLCILKCT